MPGLDLLPIGVGDAFSVKHFSTCLALRADGRWLLLDCPHPLRKMLHEASAAAGLSLDVADLEGVALTHLHADHASGVEGYGFYSKFVVGRRARLVAHPEVSRRLWEGHLAGGMEWRSGDDGRVYRSHFEDTYELVPVSEDAPAVVGPFRIECRRTRHVVPTTALRITAGGRTLGFSADTEWDPTLIDWLASADLVVHETGQGIHTPLEKLATLDVSLRKKMRLVHFADGEVLVGGPIEPLEQGRLIAV